VSRATPAAAAFSSTTVTVPLPAASTALACTTTVWPPDALSKPAAVDSDSTSPGAGARLGVPFLMIMNSPGKLVA
jgi:hypothetical protein